VKVTIGRNGERLPDGTELTATKARQEAEIIRGEWKQGINRNVVRKEQQRQQAESVAKRRADETAQLKIREVTLQTGLDRHYEKGQRASTVRGYAKVVNAHLKDWLSKPLIDISESDAIERFDVIYKKSPSNAAHAIRLLKAISKTVRILYRKQFPEFANYNPFEILNHQRKDWNTIAAREEYIPNEDLPAFYRAVAKLRSSTARDYLMVCVLTGLRMNEVCTLTWSESVDLQKKTLKITSERAKNKQRHMLAMSDYLYSLFLRRWENRSNDYVFPSSRSKAGFYNDPEKSIKQVIEDAQIEPFSSHSLRRTFATAADDIGYDLSSIQRLLNHKPGSMAERHYIQRHVEKTREPMQRINDYLLEKMGVKETAKQEANNNAPQDIRQ
jgi:integrase